MGVGPLMSNPPVPRQQTLSIAGAIQQGLRCYRQGRLEEAERLYQAVLKARPQHFDALHLLGMLCTRQGRFEAAVKLISRALERQPRSAAARHSLGIALSNLGRHEEALASYDEALAIEAGHVEAHYNRGAALAALNRHEEALGSYASVLALKPGHASAHYNLGNALQALNRHEEAVASYDRALAVRPGHGNALYNRGKALRALGRHEEAIASYNRVLAVRPDDVPALYSRGVALQALKRHEEAMASYGLVNEIRPDFAPAQLNDGICRLLTGDFERGWEKYEWRWKVENDLHTPRRDFGRAVWLGGEDIAGRTILLHAEQGLGDTIQFCRYVRLLAGKGAGRVILEVQRPLKTLISGIAGADQVLGAGEPLRDFDVHTPLLSLPLAFRTRMETIPAGIPYLSARADLAQKWRARLGQHDKPRVGIVWSGRPENTNDRNRSIALHRFLPLMKSGVRLVSLQKEVRAEDRAVLAHHGEILHFGADLTDFSETAALVSLLDRVIAVDTAVAHLAGALGKPVWILLPFAAHWLWLLDREDSPWYPTARLFRQPGIGDWDSVMQRVAGELARVGR